MLVSVRIKKKKAHNNDHGVRNVDFSLQICSEKSKNLSLYHDQSWFSFSLASNGGW